MVAKVATKPEFLFAKKKMLVTLPTISVLISNPVGNGVMIIVS